MVSYAALLWQQLADISPDWSCVLEHCQVANTKFKGVGYVRHTSSTIWDPRLDSSTKKGGNSGQATRF